MLEERVPGFFARGAAVFEFLQCSADREPHENDFAAAGAKFVDRAFYVGVAGCDGGFHFAPKASGGTKLGGGGGVKSASQPSRTRVWRRPGRAEHHFLEESERHQQQAPEEAALLRLRRSFALREEIARAQVGPATSCGKNETASAKSRSERVGRITPR